MDPFQDDPCLNKVRAFTAQPLARSSRLNASRGRQHQHVDSRMSGGPWPRS